MKLILVASLTRTLSMMMKKMETRMRRQTLSSRCKPVDISNNALAQRKLTMASNEVSTSTHRQVKLAKRPSA